MQTTYIELINRVMNIAFASFLPVWKWRSEAGKGGQGVQAPGGGECVVTLYLGHSLPSQNHFQIPQGSESSVAGLALALQALTLGWL